MQLFLREHALLPGTWTSGNVCCVVCVFRSTETMSKTVSYRCKPWTSGWHISNTQKGMRGGAKPQWRAVPQSLNSGGIVGGDLDCTTTAYTCSLHVCLPTNQYSTAMCSWSAMATHRKWQQAKKAHIWNQSRPKRLISSERGIPVYTLCFALHCNGLFLWQRPITDYETTTLWKLEIRKLWCHISNDPLTQQKGRWFEDV